MIIKIRTSNGFFEVFLIQVKRETYRSSPEIRGGGAFSRADRGRKTSRSMSG
jgi:hypothetical protein